MTTPTQAVELLRTALKKAEYAIKGREHTGFITEALAATATIETPTGEPVAKDLRVKLADTLQNCASMLDTIKMEWQREGAWSEYDQGVRDSVTTCIAALSTDPAYATVWPLRNPERLKAGDINPKSNWYGGPKNDAPATQSAQGDPMPSTADDGPADFPGVDIDAVHQR